MAHLHETMSNEGLYINVMSKRVAIILTLLHATVSSGDEQ